MSLRDFPKAWLSKRPVQEGKDVQGIEEKTDQKVIEGMVEQTTGQEGQSATTA